MKIYTKTGDDGTTALFGGRRIPKSNLRIDAYGTVDELNAHIGLLADFEVNNTRKDFLVRVQDRLFTIGAMLATEPGNTAVRIPKLSESDITHIEKEIDDLSAKLPALKSFILPGGNVAVSHAHIARTVCRRAERLVVGLNTVEPVDPRVIIFLNRLSDYLFVLARMMAQDLDVKDRIWKPGLQE